MNNFIVKYQKLSENALVELSDTLSSAGQEDTEEFIAVEYLLNCIADRVVRGKARQLEMQLQREALCEQMKQDMLNLYHVDGDTLFSKYGYLVADCYTLDEKQYVVISHIARDWQPQQHCFDTYEEAFKKYKQLVNWLVYERFVR